MASQKAWYWLAAGVLVLGLNSEYQSGKLQCIHRYVDHSLTVANNYARCAGHYLAQAHLLSLAHSSPAPVAEDAETTDAQTVQVNEEVQYALAQAETARQQIELQRPEIERAVKNLRFRRAQIEIARRIAMDTADQTYCPRKHIRVTTAPVNVVVPRICVKVPSVNVEVPAVRVRVPQVNVATDDTDDTI
jgi:hypothetical protein